MPLRLASDRLYTQPSATFDFQGADCIAFNMLFARHIPPEAKTWGDLKDSARDLLYSVAHATTCFPETVHHCVFLEALFDDTEERGLLGWRFWLHVSPGTETEEDDDGGGGGRGDGQQASSSSVINRAFQMSFRKREARQAARRGLPARKRGRPQSAAAEAVYVQPSRTSGPVRLLERHATPSTHYYKILAPFFGPSYRHEDQQYVDAMNNIYRASERECKISPLALLSPQSAMLIDSHPSLCDQQQTLRNYFRGHALSSTTLHRAAAAADDDDDGMLLDSDDEELLSSMEEEEEEEQVSDGDRDNDNDVLMQQTLNDMLDATFLSLTRDNSFVQIPNERFFPGCLDAMPIPRSVPHRDDWADNIPIAQFRLCLLDDERVVIANNTDSDAVPPEIRDAVKHRLASCLDPIYSEFKNIAADWYRLVSKEKPTRTDARRVVREEAELEAKVALRKSDMYDEIMIRDAVTTVGSDGRLGSGLLGGVGDGDDAEDGEHRTDHLYRLRERISRDIIKRDDLLRLREAHLASFQQLKDEHANNPDRDAYRTQFSEVQRRALETFHTTFFKSDNVSYVVKQAREWFNRIPPEQRGIESSWVLGNQRAYATFRAWILETFNTTFGIATAQSVFELLYFCRFSAFRFTENGEDPRLNVGMCGNGATSKSKAARTVEILTFPGPFVSIGSFTKSVWTLGEDFDGRILVLEELPSELAYKQSAKNSSNGSDLTNLFKNMMTRSTVKVLRSERDPDTDRWGKREIECLCQFVTFWASNTSDIHMDPALRSRTILRHMTVTKRLAEDGSNTIDKTPFDFVARDPYNEQIIHDHQKLSFYVFYMESAIKAGVFPNDILMDTAEIVVRKVLKKLKTRLPLADTLQHRPYTFIIQLARTMTLVYAVWLALATPIGESYRGDPCSGEQFSTDLILKVVQRFMYVQTDQIVDAVSMLGFMYFKEETHRVLRIMANLTNLDNPNKPTSYRRKLRYGGGGGNSVGGMMPSSVFAPEPAALYDWDYVAVEGPTYSAIIGRIQDAYGISHTLSEDTINATLNELKKRQIVKRPRVRLPDGSFGEDPNTDPVPMPYVRFQHNRAEKVSAICILRDFLVSLCGLSFLQNADDDEEEEANSGRRRSSDGPNPPAKRRRVVRHALDTLRKAEEYVASVGHPIVETLREILETSHIGLDKDPRHMGPVKRKKYLQSVERREQHYTFTPIRHNPHGYIDRGPATIPWMNFYVPHHPPPYDLRKEDIDGTVYFHSLPTILRLKRSETNWNSHEEIEKRTLHAAIHTRASTSAQRLLHFQRSTGRFQRDADVSRLANAAGIQITSDLDAYAARKVLEVNCLSPEHDGLSNMDDDALLWNWPPHAYVILEEIQRRRDLEQEISDAERRWRRLKSALDGGSNDDAAIAAEERRQQVLLEDLRRHEAIPNKIFELCALLGSEPPTGPGAEPIDKGLIRRKVEQLQALYSKTEQSRSSHYRMSYPAHDLLEKTEHRRTVITEPETFQSLEHVVAAQTTASSDDPMEIDNEEEEELIPFVGGIRCV